MGSYGVIQRDRLLGPQFNRPGLSGMTCLGVTFNTQGATLENWPDPVSTEATCLLVRLTHLNPDPRLPPETICLQGNSNPPFTMNHV